MVEINIVQTHSLNFQGKEIPLFNVNVFKQKQRCSHRTDPVLHNSDTLCVSTWMRLAAGFLLFSKCFCRCCSCTFSANPDPRMPWNTHIKISTHTRPLQRFTGVIVWCCSQLVKQRRRSPEERNQPIISVQSRSVGSCLRNQ